MKFGDFADAQWVRGVVSASVRRLCGVIWASYGCWGRLRVSTGYFLIS